MGKHCGAGRGDIISGLPDSILLQILFYLDMKHAVQTSILSKRWRYLWASLRILDFDAEQFYSPTTDRCDGFQNFVDQVLLLRENSDIDGFYLTSVFKPCHCDITKFVDIWILAVTRRKVQSLDLDLYGDGIRLPNCLFTCTSLTELTLGMGGSERWGINLQKSMGLPNLKVLKLASLSFNDEILTNNFFLSCPNLEELTLEDVEFLHMNVSISALKLEEFTVENQRQAYNYGYCRWIKTKFRLYAPNLRYIHCKDYMFSDYIFHKLSSLIHADIDMKLEEEDEEPVIDTHLLADSKQMYAQRMIRFLKALHYVEHLELSAGFLEVVSGSPDLLYRLQTEFSDLTCLALETHLARDTICAITYLLKLSPILESLSLEIRKIQNVSTNIDDYCEEVLPLHNLKFVTIRGAVGCVNELKFLEILLKNAEVLEKLVIFTCKENLPDREKCQVKFSDKLSTFPRASSNITIIFI